MEVAEIRQIRHVRHQRLHPRVKGCLSVLATLRQLVLDLVGDLHESPDQLGHVAARVVDVRLQQHRVPRGLVQLDVVVVCQHLLELRPVEAGGAADQREAGGIEAELVIMHASDLVVPRQPGREEIHEPAFAVGGRDHVAGPEHPEVFGNQRMVVHLAPDIECDLDGVRHKPVAFQLHLAPGDVEACDQLLVGRGRGMGEDRLVELRLDVAEVDVLDEKHRTLPQRRHRLVGRVGLVDPQPHLARIGDEARFQKGFGRGVLAQFRLLPLPRLYRGRVLYPGLDGLGRAHRRAGAQEGRPAGEAEPGLVP